MANTAYLLRALLILVLLAFPKIAEADVSVTFYSHDFGEHFPHAFFVAQGNLSDGALIDEAFGFTASNISPAILLGSVKGHVSTPKTKYIQNSKPHFTLLLDDEQYHNLKLVVHKWNAIPGKSYSLNKRNCVHFIAESLTTLGYTVNIKSKYFKKPKSFLREVKTLNPALQPAFVDNQ